MALDTYSLQMVGTKSSTVSDADVQASFSATVAAYGGTIVSVFVQQGSLQIILSLPDTKTVAQLKTLIADIESDLTGEFTQVTGIPVQITLNIF